MTAFVYYVAKLTLCSGILTGYYWLALRNKTFHRWNRAYLLLAVVLSLAAPLLIIRIGSPDAASSNKVFRILNAVTVNGEEVVVESGGTGTFPLTTEQLLVLAYSLVSLLLLLIVAVNAFRIFALLRSHPKTKLGDITFLNTHVQGTPFSFFHYIVWNAEIDISSETGRQIFQHELAHARQRHTWDKVFLLLILIPFWINPFFWIIRRELHSLHEFAADEKAVGSNDSSALAQLILHTAFPQKNLLFTNPFFQSTIKRRIAMFTKLQNPSVNYLSRIIALPIVLIVLAAFAVKTRPLAKQHVAALDQKITVVIDAGHGGRQGARFEDIYEDDIALAIAKKIKTQNTNRNLQIILTRESDVNTRLNDRVQIASDKKADLFLSVHLNASDPDSQTAMQQSGMEVVVSAKNTPYQPQSELLGSVLVQELGTAYATRPDLVKLKTGIWVVDANVCPAVLIECGYLSNEKDRAFITQEQNQTAIASKILNAIERYAVLKNSSGSGSASVRDTVPKLSYKNKEVARVNYIKDEKDNVEVIYKDGKKETITAKEAKKANLLDADTTVLTVFTPPVIQPDTIPQVKFANGSMSIRMISYEQAEQFEGKIQLNDKIFKGSWKQLPVKKNDIDLIPIIKGDAVEKELGINVGDSALSIYTKAYTSKQNRSNDKPIFTKSEVEPSFVGDWQKFLQQNLNADVSINNRAPTGTYKVVLQFVVDENGKLSDFKPLTKYGYGMENEVLRLMKTSPDWIPAKQNGRNVTAYKKQTITFIVSES